MNKTWSYRDNSGLVRAAVSLLYIYAAICAAAAVSGFLELDLLLRVKAQAFTSQAALIAEAEASDRRQQVLGIAQLASLLATGVASLVWVYRAKAKARAMGADLEPSPRRAVRWFAVPLAVLVMPYQVMSELWRGSAEPLCWRDAAQPDWLIRGWWGLLLLTTIAGLAVGQAMRTEDDIPAYIGLLQISIAVDLVAIVVVLLYAAIIRGIHRMQRPPAEA